MTLCFAGVALVYCQSCALLVGWSFLDEPETVRTVYDVFRHWRFLGEWTPAGSELHLQPHSLDMEVENSDPSGCHLESADSEGAVASHIVDEESDNVEDFESDIYMSDDASEEFDQEWKPGSSL